MSHTANAKAGFMFRAKMRGIATEPEGQRKVNNANAKLPPFESTRE